jgi:hypothetical protein
MQYKYKTVSDVYSTFTKFEKENDLIYFEIEGIKIWQILRYEIFFKITEKIFFLGAAQLTSSISLKLSSLPSILYNSLFKNAWSKNNTDTIVFPHSRVHLVENEYIDIHTKYLVDDLLSGGFNCLVLEKSYLHKHYTRKADYVKYLDDSVLFAALISKIFIVNTSAHKDFIKLIVDKLNILFGIDFDLKYLIINRLSKFKAYYLYYTWLLKKLRPKQIFVVVSYSEPWLVSAAKDLGIRVKEIQHGAFSKYHLGYSYDKDYQLNYLPDEFLVWNQFWKKSVPFPLDEDNIKIYPSKFQNIQKSKYESLIKIKNQVVVLSQGTVSNMIAKLILENFAFFENKTIKFKLHPGEIQRYASYNYLIKLLNKPNVELIVQGDLYKLLATSEYQVGVYSTTIYEGLAFGLKTILCNLPFVECMENLFEDGRVELMLYEKTHDQ